MATNVPIHDHGNSFTVVRYRTPLPHPLEYESRCSWNNTSHIDVVLKRTYICTLVCLYGAIRGHTNLVLSLCSTLSMYILHMHVSCIWSHVKTCTCIHACTCASKLVNRTHHKRTWCALRLQGCSKAAQEVMFQFGFENINSRTHPPQIYYLQ